MSLVPEYISLKSHLWVYNKFQRKTWGSCNEELSLQSNEKTV